MKSKKKTIRPTRSDGEKTKKKIISTAFDIFAEKGFQATTSREICKKAGVNEASVVYYFGSKEALYAEVLRSANNQIFPIEELERITTMKAPIEKRIRKLLELICKRPEAGGSSKVIQIYLREILNPSKVIASSIQEILLPKLKYIIKLGSEASGLPEDSIELRRIVVFACAPCVVTKIYPQVFIKTVFGIESTSDDEFIDSMCDTAMRILRGR